MKIEERQEPLEERQEPLEMFTIFFFVKKIPNNLNNVWQVAAKNGNGYWQGK